MIGRASFGRPWIFKEVKHYLETGEELPPLSFEWCMEVLRQEVVDSVNLLDERRGILHVRRHLAASPLFKGILTSATHVLRCYGQKQKKSFSGYLMKSLPNAKKIRKFKSAPIISILQELVLVPEE